MSPFFPTYPDANPGAIAFGGGVFLAVWTATYILGPLPSFRTDVVGARFAPDGTLLDPGGFVICTNCAAVYSGVLTLNVAASNTGFWVVWENGGALVGFDGKVIRVRQPLVENPQAGLFLNPNIACAPGACVIVWSGDFGVWIAGMPPDGLGVGAPDLVYPAVGGSLPLIANNGDEFLVAAGNLAVRYTTTPYLHVLDNKAIQVGGSAAIAADGSSFLLAWTSSSGIYAQKVLGDGTVQSPHQIATEVSSGGPMGVASTGDGFRLVWKVAEQSSLLHSAALSASDVAGPVTTVGLTSFENVAIAGSPSGYLIDWNDVDLYAAFIGATASSPGLPLIVSAPGDVDPTAAASNSEYFVAWARGLNERQITAIHFTSPTDFGSNFVPNFIVAPTSADQSTPAAASDGTDFAVVWDDTRNGDHDIYGARVSSGVAAPAVAIAGGSAPQKHPALASNGLEYLALWEEQSAIRGARLAPDLSAIGAAFQVSVSSNAHSAPAIASDGKDYLAVWVSQGTVDQVVGVRIRADGTLVDSAEVGLGPSGDAQAVPAVAWNGRSYLAVWRESNSSGRTLRGARVRRDGTISAILMDSMTRSDEPAVGALCDAHLVAWQDGDATSAMDIGAALLPYSTSRTTALPIATTVADERKPAIAMTGATALVTYNRNASIFARLVTATCAPSVDGGTPDGSAGANGGMGGFSGMAGFDAGIGDASSGGSAGAGGASSGGSAGAGGASSGGSAGAGGVSSGGSVNADAGPGGNAAAGAGGASSGGGAGVGGTSSGGSVNADAGPGGNAAAGAGGGGKTDAGTGTGGESPGDAASGGAAGSGTGHPGKGCSCRMGATDSTGSYAVVSLCMLSVLLARRRRSETRRWGDGETPSDAQNRTNPSRVRAAA